MSFFSKTFYILAVTSLTRHVYYTGWMLGDSICNMSGMGFNGYSADGTAKWNLVSNVDIIGVEVRHVKGRLYWVLKGFLLLNAERMGGGRGRGILSSYIFFIFF